MKVKPAVITVVGVRIRRPRRARSSPFEAHRDEKRERGDVAEDEADHENDRIRDEVARDVANHQPGEMALLAA